MSRLILQRLALTITLSLGAGVMSGLLFFVLFTPEQRAFFGDSNAALWVTHLVTSILAGTIYAQLFARNQESYAEGLMSGIAYGVVVWVASIIIVPLLRGLAPGWTVEVAVQTLPLLITHIVLSSLLGLGCAFINRRFPLPPRIIEEKSPAENPTRVVVIGGGFAGVEVAQGLEKLFKERQRNDLEITVISKSNHLLFTPMLTEVVSGGVQGQHITPPLRTFFDDVTIIRGEPSHIDTNTRQIEVTIGSDDNRTITYDHLVLATGAVPNYFGNDNLEKYTIPFKSLPDAIYIRNHIISKLEQADSESDPERRKALLTFVVVGGGFAGVELIGGMNDFIRGSHWYYPNIPVDEIKLILIHAGETILPELSQDLGVYAQQKMEERGVTFRLKSRMSNATPEAAFVGDDVIPTYTTIWTAGNVPHPLGKEIGLPVNKRGAVIVNEQLQVQDHDNIWAVGDVALIPDLITGKNAPPTAQYATREGKVLAHNLYAAITSEKLKPFKHRSQGSLAVVGHQTAVAEVGGFKFSGLFAFLMWRAIYITKLPTFEKKVHVAIDWIIDLFFPRDITYVDPLAELAAAPQATQPTLQEVS